MQTEVFPCVSATHMQTDKQAETEVYMHAHVLKYLLANTNVHLTFVHKT